MSHNMIILDFNLPYFHASNTALFVAEYSDSLIYIDVVLTLYIWNYIRRQVPFNESKSSSFIAI